MMIMIKVARRVGKGNTLDQLDVHVGSLGCSRCPTYHHTPDQLQIACRFIHLINVKDKTIKVLKDNITIFMSIGEIFIKQNLKISNYKK